MDENAISPATIHRVKFFSKVFMTSTRDWGLDERGSVDWLKEVEPLREISCIDSRWRIIFDVVPWRVESFVVHLHRVHDMRRSFTGLLLPFPFPFPFPFPLGVHVVSKVVNLYWLQTQALSLLGLRKLSLSSSVEVSPAVSADARIDTGLST
jgi:hypothetical protein